MDEFELIDARSKMLHKELDRRRSNRFLIVIGILSLMTIGLISFAFVTHKGYPKKAPKHLETKFKKY